MSLQAIKSAVKAASSERAQINAVVASLARAGVKGAAHPEVHTTSVDRSTFRIYLWRNAIDGETLVLATGPSFEPAVLLGSQIPHEGPGIYVRSLIAESGSVKALAGADRTASRVERAAAKVGQAAAKVDKAVKRAERAVERVEAVAEAVAAPEPVYVAPEPVYVAPPKAPRAPKAAKAGGGGGSVADFIAVLKQMKNSGQI